MFDLLLQGFAIILNPWTLSAALAGLVAGIIVGALPGLTATMAVAVLVPFTFFIEATIGIPFLLGVYKGAIYGGSIPAIVINTPGTAAAAATTLDGHALAKKGQARRALEMSLFASVFGDLFATFILILAAAPLAEFALRFSSPDFAALLVFSMTVIATVSGQSMLKGLISAALGLAIAVIGLDPMSGGSRFTFGIPDLMGGISLVPLLIGMFALSEIFVQAEQGQKRITVVETAGDEPRLRVAEFFKHRKTLIRSSSIGAMLGALPGLGAEISCWIAYGAAKRASKTPQEFGRGSLDGVAAAESGNNSVCPAALIPMLVFGIPGDTVTAVLLGAFLAHGLNPGPLLFEKHGDILYSFYAVLLFTNVALLLLGLVAIRWLRHISLIPNGLLMPAVIGLCFAGSFAVNSSYFDLIVTFVGGVAGYLMRRAEVPIPPLVISLLLAPALEQAARQSLMFSDGSLLIFVTRPISGVFVALTVISIAMIVWRNLATRRLQPQA